MKEDKLTIVKTYHFGIDGKKVMDHYSTYNNGNAFITSNSLGDLSKKVSKYGGSISYKVPETLLRSKPINKKKRKYRFLGQVEYFHEPLSSKERGYINTKINQKSINKKSKINKSLEEKLAESGYN